MNPTADRFRGLIRSLGKIIPILIGFVALTLVIAWISGFFSDKISPGESEPTDRKLAGQSTDVVHEITKEYLEETVGTLKAASRSQISAKVLATIDEILVTAGDTVAPGDLLITLNSQEFESRLQQAEETLNAATAAAQEAQSDFDRLEKLLQSNVISQQEFDVAKGKLEVRLADQRRAQRAVEEAKVLLSYTRIEAPKAGRIVDRLAEPGDTAQPGQPLLTLYDVTTLRLETPVLENLAIQLSVGQELQVYVDSVDREFTATVDEIVPQADVASRSFLVKASLPRNENLYEGMFGRLRIPAGSRQHLCLPTDAILRIGQLEFVDVVGDGDRLERRLIKTGRLGMPGRVEVLSGVTAGDRVVLHPDEFADESTSDEPGGAQ